MIKPTVGRVMWFWPEIADREDQPLAALVTRVHGDNMVNLAVFNSDGTSGGERSVPIVQEASPYAAGDAAYCEWMPYQKAVASGQQAPTLHAQPK